MTARLAITMATNHNVSVSVLLLAMVQFAHDREVVRSYVEAGAIPAESVCLDTALGMLDWDDLVALMTEGGEMSEDIKYEVGMDCLGYDHKMSVVRQIRDVLDNSVLALYGKDDDVTAWADSLGGLRAVQEELCGVSLKKDMWYETTCRELFLERGYHVKPLGEPQMEYEVEGATSHTSYAVEAHRLLVNRKAHGEVEDDDTTTPSWALSEFDFNISSKPSWWKGVAIGKFNTNVWLAKVTKDVAGNPHLRQVETRKGMNWTPDIRISDIPEKEDYSTGDVIDAIGNRFTHITKIGPWSQMSDNSTVKHFTDLFYNHPDQLVWKKVGKEGKERWACGMLTPRGKVMWAMVTGSTSKKMDWQNKLKADLDAKLKIVDATPGLKLSDLPKWERKGTRCLYIGQWAIAYKKDWKKDCMVVTKYKQDNQTALWAVYNENKIDCDGFRQIDPTLSYKEWGSIKRKFLKLGAVDAYLGKPWKLYVKPDATPEEKAAPYTGHVEL